MANPHHIEMCKVLDKVFTGEIKRLIINIPPGYTKTELAVINFVAHGLAIAPYARFIHASYSNDLALLNSTIIRDIINLEQYQALWPMPLRQDTKSKRSWYTSEKGGLLSVASGGAITGFRAGRMVEGFSGALIIDDPIKPDDAYSSLIRNRVNNRFTNTFKSRLAHEDIPIIVIMQRLHEDDPTGFLLKGGTKEKWHHLLLPALIDPGAKYPKEYKFGVPIPHNLEPGPLWRYKHTEEHLKVMSESDSYTYSSQYDQRPSPIGGGLFKDKWWRFYREVPMCKYRFITADTAQKTLERHDYSVFQLWGLFEGNLYLIDQIKGKWEAPELRKKAIAFWNKHKGTGNETVGRLRAMYIEDKASGTGLVQDLRKLKTDPIPIIPVPRNKDKVTRAMDMAPYIEVGRIYIPLDQDWVADYMLEFGKFTAMMTHRYDDQVDATLDAIDIALRSSVKVAGTW